LQFFFYVAFGLIFSGESFGILFCSIFYEPGFSLNVTSLIFSIMICMSGILSANMPTLLQGLNYASIMKYSVELTMVNVVKDASFNCSAEEIATGQCTIENGQQLLDVFGFSTNDFVLNIIVVFALIFIYRVIAFLALKFKKINFAQ